MTKITKEFALEIINGTRTMVSFEEVREMARMLLAGMEQEPMVPDEADPRDAFESVFAMPKHAQRCGKGYASTSYSAWDTHKFIDRWDGWNACRAAMLNEPHTRVQSANIPVKGIDNES